MARIEATCAAHVRDAVAAAAAAGTRLEIRGGGTKAAIGAPRQVPVLDVSAVRGVVDYDPAELVLTLRPGTPLAEVEALVASEGQMLAFEPFDHGAMLGSGAGRATIGGVVAAGVAGSRRVTAGGARDHLLGFTAVSGRGELFVAGGKVVKNVTGYDLPKLFAGSWGRLGVITELTLKVLPRPRVSATLVAEGLAPAAAHAAMARALGCHADVSAAAHLPAGTASERSLTLLRIAGFAPSVESRCLVLPGVLADHAVLRRLDPEQAGPLWLATATGACLDGPILWRVHLPPVNAPALAGTVEAFGGRWTMDWGGGMMWVAVPDDVEGEYLRTAAAALGGEAALVRAPEGLRGRIAPFQPRAAPVMALEARVRRAFDPCGVFETGRFLDNSDAD